jgi:hypothetical protein
MRNQLLSVVILLAGAALLSACGERPGSAAAPPDRTAAETVPVPAERITDATRVGFSGAGPIMIGMTRAEAERVLGETLLPPEGPGAAATDCRYVHLKTGPQGLAFMLTGNVIARIDVDGGSALRTTAGARIGSPEDEIARLYGAAVSVMPHKYEAGGHTLTVTSRDPRQNMVHYVFETDGQKVTRYRVGRVPEVDFVERCG